MNDSVKLVIKCNQSAAKSILPLLKELRFMGNVGCSRGIKIEDYSDHNDRFDFDGDGPDKIDTIELEGKLVKARDVEKARKMPIGTISRGRKKVAEGKWVPVKKEKPTVLSAKWKAAAENYGVSEEVLVKVKAKGYNLGSVTEALRYMQESSGITVRKMKQVTANQIGSLARRVKEGRAQSRWIAEHGAREAEMGKAKYIAKVLKPGGGFRYVYPHPKTGRPTMYEDIGGKIEVRAEKKPARAIPKKKVKEPAAYEAKDIRRIRSELRAIQRGKVLRMYKDPKKNEQGIKRHKKQLVDSLNKYKSKYPKYFETSKSIGGTRMNLVIPLTKGAAGTRGVPDGSGPEGKGPTGRKKGGCPKREDFKNGFEYNKAMLKWKAKNKTEKSIVLMPTEMLKAEYLGKVGSTQSHLNKVSSSMPEHKGAVKGKGNAKGTIGPKEPTGGGKTKPEGAPKAESSKKGSTPSRVKGRKPGDKPPYKNYRATASGSKSSAASNYLKMTSEKTGKPRFLKLGSLHRAKFDHAGNCIQVTVDGKRYPVQNHLVKLPTGVYHIDGMISIANKVIGAKK